MWTQKHSDYSMASSMEITNYDRCLLGIRRKGANPMPPLFSSDVVVAIATFLKLPHPHVLYNTYWAKMSLSSSNQWIILLYKCREWLKSWANVCCLTWAGHVREQDLRPVKSAGPSRTGTCGKMAKPPQTGSNMSVYCCFISVFECWQLQFPLAYSLILLPRDLLPGLANSSPLGCM